MPAGQRIEALKSYLLGDNALVPTLASHLGGIGAEFETSIRGDSMAPAIPAGARLRVRVLQEKAYGRGDIVFFFTDNGFIVHRIAHWPRWGAAVGYFLTRGDACLVPDVPVKGDRVIGTVVAFRSGGDWQPAGVEAGRSILHRAVRMATLAAVTATSRISVGGARRLIMVLRSIESTVRAPAGRILRRFRLLSSKR
jgi:hypothetical protein